MDGTVPQRLGSYMLMGMLARGGLATVHVGRRIATSGFRTTVAIKRLLPDVRGDADVRAMLIDEARVSSRLHHPNIAGCIDVVEEGDELLLVMPFVEGVSLAELSLDLAARGERCPVEVACRLVHDALLGLHAAHTALDERGAPLAIVHRDVSPQNVLVGADGVVRVVDFGVAKARVKLHQTRGAIVRGKLRYMAPEQLRGDVTAASDQWSAACLLWELLAGRPLRDAPSETGLWMQALNESPPAIRDVVPGIPPVLDEVLGHALARDPSDRHPSCKDLAQELEAALDLASEARVGELVARVSGDRLAARARLCEEAERLDVAEATALMPMPVEPAKRSARLMPFVVLGGVLVALVALVALSSRSAGDQGVARSTGVATSASTPGAALAAAPPLAVSASPTTTAEPAASHDGPLVAASGPASPVASAGRRRASHGEASDPSRTKTNAPPRRAECDPPFVLDDHGRKMYKIECVRER
ncbi:MAG: serine/threonine protein kinase [Deltaproteobacteria bacterium]|nr:serine/threonine protein kinase [Deltaproteobacteria bacterium]